MKNSDSNNCIEQQTLPTYQMYMVKLLKWSIVIVITVLSNKYKPCLHTKCTWSNYWNEE
jgi:hypothetical protein